MMRSATIMLFPGRLQAIRFTQADRLELQQLGALLRERGLARMVMHERLDADPPELGNYLALYAAGESLASWGLMRRGSGVVLWHCGTGRDLGCFVSVREALLSLPQERCRHAVSGLHAVAVG